MKMDLEMACLKRCPPHLRYLSGLVDMFQKKLVRFHAKFLIKSCTFFCKKENFVFYRYLLTTAFLVKSRKVKFAKSSAAFELLNQDGDQSVYLAHLRQLRFLFQHRDAPSLLRQR